MLGPWVATLLAVPCAGIAVQPDPMVMERGAVSANGSLYSEMAAMSAQAAALEAKMEAQAGECKKEKPTDRAPSGSANAGVFNRPWTKDMKMLRDSELWGQRMPAAVPEPGQDVKMAFLMFANDRIDNEEIWLHWMEEGRKAGLSFSMYIHAYGLPPRGNSHWRSEEFKQYLVEGQARSTWCQMWEAQMMLVKRAVQEDMQATHFVMLSSDSVPVKPMGWIYNQTRDQPLSRFCVDDFWRDPWPRAETWSMMRRGDAKFFVDNEEFAEKHLRRDCEEELAWYFPLRVRWDNFGEKAPLKRECIMFTNWKDGEKACKEAWAENAEKCNCPRLRKTNSTAANFRHPVVYHKVTADAYEELVRSPYWFARKFSADGVPGHLKTVMDIDITKPKKKKKLFGMFR